MLAQTQTTNKIVEMDASLFAVKVDFDMNDAHSIIAAIKAAYLAGHQAAEAESLLPHMPADVLTDYIEYHTLGYVNS